MPLVAALRIERSGWMSVAEAGLFFGATGSWILAYGAALKATAAEPKAWWSLPAALMVGVGLAFNNSRALLEAVLETPGETPGAFVRTPKVGFAWAMQDEVTRVRGIAALWDGTTTGFAQSLVEVAFGLYVGSGVILALMGGRPFAALFHALFAAGFLLMGLGSLREAWRIRSPFKALTVPS